MFKTLFSVTKGNAPAFYTLNLWDRSASFTSLGVVADTYLYRTESLSLVARTSAATILLTDERDRQGCGALVSQQ